MPETAKEVLQDRLRERDYFALDANVLIGLAADERDLNRLLVEPRFRYLNIIDVELKKLLKGDKIKGKVRDNLIRFIKKARVVEASEKEKEKFREELKPLVTLLPRKIAHDVVIAFIDRLVREYERCYQILKERALTRDELRELQRFYEQEKNRLPAIIREEFNNRSQGTTVDLGRINVERFLKNAEKFLNILLRDLDEVRKRHAGTFEGLIATLKAYVKKGYKADVEFVASTLAHGAVGGSLDNDVISLFELHTARAV